MNRTDEPGVGHKDHSRHLVWPRAMWRPAIVLVAGLAIAWMDTRPSWDDTGVTAAALLITSALGSLAGVKPWLSASLVVLPLLVAEISGGMGILIAILFPVAGAYAGAFIRSRVFSK